VTSVVALADAIARHLADGPWAAGPDPHEHKLRAEVARCDGVSFFLELVGSRIEARGIYPRGVTGYVFSPYGERAPHCTVAARRNPASIAREIDRRFMPAFLAAHRKAVADVEEQRLSLERARAVAEQIAEASGGTLYRFDRRLEEQWSVHVPDGVIRVRSSSPEQPDIRFELHGAPSALAFRVAAALRPSRKRS